MTDVTTTTVDDTTVNDTVDTTADTVVDQTTDTQDVSTNDGDTLLNKDDKDSVADKSDVEGAPESYEDFSVPENIEVDAAVLTNFKELAKEANLSQANAQKLVDMQTKLMQEHAEASNKAWIDTKNSWEEAAKTDKEYGGQQFNDNLAVAKKALDTYGSPALREVFETTGVGSNPEVIRFCVNVGKTIKEADIVKGTTQATEATMLERLYPTMAKTN